MQTFAIEFGWCGFGAVGGLIPELRLGVLRLWCCSESVVTRLSALRCALADAVVELRGRR